MIKLFLLLLTLLTTPCSYGILNGETIGKRSLSDEWSTVALQMKFKKTNGDYAYRKGTAFIVNDNTLITAGHNAFYIDPATNIEAIFSTQPCWGPNLCQEKRIAIQEKIVHPKFENNYPAPPIFDIAILRLSETIPKNFIALNLPTKKDILTQKLTFYGYGNSLEAPTLKDYKLRKIGWKNPGFIIGQEQKFIFQQPRGGFCGGDSGGPLITQVNDKFIAIGIAIHHTQKEESNKDFGCLRPGVYTDIAFFSDWIQMNL